MAWRRDCTLVTLAISQAACSTRWNVIASARPESLPAKQRVQVWTGTASRELRAVIVGADSITGIPSQQPIDCSICRVGYPKAAVDSTRVRVVSISAPRAVGLGAAALVIVTVFVCSRGGCTAE